MESEITAQLPVVGARCSKKSATLCEEGPLRDTKHKKLVVRTLKRKKNRGTLWNFWPVVEESCTRSWDKAETRIWQNRANIAPSTIGLFGLWPAKEGWASFNWRRHVTCFVEKAGFEPRTLRIPGGAHWPLCHSPGGLWPARFSRFFASRSDPLLRINSGDSLFLLKFVTLLRAWFPRLELCTPTSVCFLAWIWELYPNLGWSSYRWGNGVLKSVTDFLPSQFMPGILILKTIRFQV